MDGTQMESRLFDTQETDASLPWWRHRWIRATSLFVAGVLVGSIAGGDGQVQVAELQRQLAAARAAAQPSDGPSQTSTVISLEQQLKDMSHELRDTTRKLEKATHVAKQRRRRLAALKNDLAALMSEHATLLAAGAADQRPLMSSAEVDETAGEACDPSYPDVCIPSQPPDLDCPDIGYSDFRVTDPDPHGFDDDGDGVGCVS